MLDFVNKVKHFNTLICLFYFSIFRTLHILKQVFWGRNLISIFLASQNRYHTNTEVSQIWMKKKKNLLTQRMFLRIKILIWYTYLLICMAMILGFVFFLTSEVTIFLRLFKQTMHQKVFLRILTKLIKAWYLLTHDNYLQVWYQIQTQEKLLLCWPYYAWFPWM